MAGEESYIHPIIQGFLQGAAQAKEAGQYQTTLKQRQLEHQDEVKQQESLLKQAQQRIDEAHQQHIDELDLARQTHELAANRTRAELTKMVAEHIRGGVMQVLFKIRVYNFHKFRV